jgi:hypothetical protein
MSDSEPDNSEATTNPSEMIADKGRARKPERSGEATDASPSENGAKPDVDENAGISRVGEDSMNGNTDKVSKEERN